MLRKAIFAWKDNESGLRTFAVPGSWDFTVNGGEGINVLTWGVRTGL